MEAYDNEREQEIGQGADDTPYQRWLATRTQPKWKCEDCDAVNNENDLCVIWGKGNWPDDTCCPECRSTNLKEDGEDKI